MSVSVRTSAAGTFSLQLVPRADAAQLAQRIKQGGANPKQRIDSLRAETPLVQVVKKCMGKWVNTVGEDSSSLRLWSPKGAQLVPHSTTVGAIWLLLNRPKPLRLEYDLASAATPSSAPNTARQNALAATAVSKLASMASVVETIEMMF